jgi:hypothetical protein
MRKVETRTPEERAALLQQIQDLKEKENLST